MANDMEILIERFVDTEFPFEEVDENDVVTEPDYVLEYAEEHT
jgi:hypothetical protein